MDGIRASLCPAFRVVGDMQIRCLARTAAAALVVLAATVAPAGADYRAAVSAFETGNYEAARREFQALANQGFSLACCSAHCRAIFLVSTWTASSSSMISLPALR